jgi:hypothetical protein
MNIKWRTLYDPLEHDITQANNNEEIEVSFRLQVVFVVFVIPIIGILILIKCNGLSSILFLAKFNASHGPSFE